ncbi:MAG: methyl-accepting chemotaxis protein [Clostridiales Family XIII bacterium]|nr:methyl-accepting chemotaxis protein [Clostridiales Family XIII bacterium]
MIDKLPLSKKLWSVYIAYSCFAFPVLIISYIYARYYVKVHDLDAAQMLRTLLVIYIAGVVLGSCIIIPLALMIQKAIITPLKDMEQGARKLAVGDTSVNFDFVSSDEIGQLSSSLQSTVEAIREESEMLDQMVAGDYNITVNVRSPEDDMFRSLSEIIQSKGDLMRSLKKVSHNMSDAAISVAADSQNLAHGASIQASAIEELSVSIEDVRDTAANNVGLTDDVLINVNKNMDRIEEIMQDMNHMVHAMDIIAQSSGQMSKVINVIDSIAFQTNILALNAAVEAARAGAHGKGFAVVADEVRNLASKSAMATQETASLIESSVANVKAGSEIVTLINNRLTEIEELISTNSNTVTHLHAESMQQSKAIEQITSTIDEISSVVQTNTMMAENSSASAQQLSAESATLKSMIEAFKL